MIAGASPSDHRLNTGGNLYPPFVNGPVADLGWWYVPFGAFVIVAFGNSVNLTDGLDGLATMPVIIASIAFMLIAYLVGNFKYADYLGLPFILGAGDLSILCGAIVGAGLAFLWFNAPPGVVFMGDTGSLALGGVFGTSRSLPIMNSYWRSSVACSSSRLSVIIQVLV